jgi:hypothetical protein
MTFSNSVQVVVPSTQAGGLASGSWDLENFMLASDLAYIKANFCQWRPLAENMTIRITDTTALAGQAALPALFGVVPADTCSGNSLDMWLICHHSQQTATSYGTIVNGSNAATIAAARTGIVNSNMARKINPKGKPCVYQWHNIKGLDGIYDPLNTEAVTINSPIFGGTSAWPTALNINNCPYGYQVNWFDIGQYPANATITLEFTGTLVIDFVGRVFQNT